MGSNQNNYPTVSNIKEALNFIGLTHTKKCRMAGPHNIAHTVTHTVGINGQNIVCRMSTSKAHFLKMDDKTVTDSLSVSKST